MLELSGVSKKYGQATALHPTDLTVPVGRTTVLIGPSGCGKSTLLRLMIGLIQPDTGSVRIDGTPMTPETALDLRRRMGYVIQDGGLFPHLTARHNVTLMARHLGWSAKRTEARLDELADLTQFPRDGLDRYPVQLSGGQRQRVSLMRALMLDPGVLLLDEPLGALDPMIRADLQDDLARVFKLLAKTVVLVTHDLQEADFFADTIALMNEGRVVQRGNLSQLSNAPANEFVTRFLNAQHARPTAPRETS
ncbi:MAG: ATP-binding cassette domain-containing protein [Planctomycetes bacterium]|nr:ATP-binding cassette domain-containing protein [Planctomycetota bacterium]